MEDENEEKDEIIWITVIIINIFVYGLCCLLTLKRKHFSSISIRSPTLIISTNISNFLISLTLILHKIIDSNFISIFYYIFRLMLVISLCLRYERILYCFRYNKDKFNTNENMEIFAEKRYLLQEKFYVKIFIGFFGVIFISLLIIELIGINCFELFYTSYEINNDNYKSQISIWVCLNFIEMAAIMTYIFRLHNKKLKFVLKKELYIFFCILLIYSNYITFSNLYQDYNDSTFILISLVALYLLLILNGYLPIFASFFYKNILSYQITPKLMNNLYLFLTNKECYKAFCVFLIKGGDNSVYVLKLYTHLMKFKLDLALKINHEQGLREARDIYNRYFEREGVLLYVSQDVLLKVQSKCEMLRNNTFKEDMFDEGLKYAYNQLNIKFNEFIKKEEFKELQDDIEINSLVLCKMCNTGLINKF